MERAELGPLSSGDSESIQRIVAFPDFRMRIGTALQRAGNLLQSEAALGFDHRTKSSIISDIIETLKVKSTVSCSSMSRPVAIEVDGPSHFYINSTKYTAYSKLKHRILSRMGYRVIHIPFFEWNKLSSVQDKENFVLKKLVSPSTDSLTER